MLCRHMLILVVCIAIARYATDLWREMWLLLGTVAEWLVWSCKASHRRRYVYVASAVDRLSLTWILLCGGGCCAYIGVPYW